jgi:hypothetical protein
MKHHRAKYSHLRHGIIASVMGWRAISYTIVLAYVKETHLVHCVGFHAMYFGDDAERDEARGDSSTLHP